MEWWQTGRDVPWWLFGAIVGISMLTGVVLACGPSPAAEDPVCTTLEEDGMRRVVPCTTPGAVPQGFRVLNRRPPTPQSRFLGACMVFLGILAVAIGTYHIMTARLRLMVLCWGVGWLLISLGLTEFFFGDGPLSSFLW